MRNSQSNVEVLRHIKKYCDRIQELIERFGNDIDIFKSDVAFRDAVSMSILQIGELSNHLSAEFREKTKNEIQWKNIRTMRNIFAHDYEEMSTDITWETATKDIQPLKEFCEQQINMVNLLNQEALEPEYEDEFDEEI